MFAVACMCGFLLFEHAYTASIGPEGARENLKGEAGQSIQESLQQDYQRNEKPQSVGESGKAAGLAMVGANAASLNLSKYKVLLSDTDILREKGLGGRASLSQDSVMLFAFAEDARHYFWMKDMQFSIDMVWLDKDKKVIHVESGVAPDTFPEAFGPKEDSRYVLEFSEGAVRRENIRAGEQVVF